MREPYNFWSSSISSFFWHPVVGFAMLNCPYKKNMKTTSQKTNKGFSKERKTVQEIKN
jgi:hypothetical protein